jgi:hypothetical protein
MATSIHQITDNRQTCFTGGCQEFWLVGPKKHTLQTCTPEAVPITTMDAGPLPVSTIFQAD